MSQSWAVTWRKALVSVPRLVPDVVLNFTSAEGPQPVVIKVPSRGKHTVPLYVFIPPSDKTSKSAISSDAPTKYPVLIDFHGGGFVLGSCQEQAPFCAKLCRELQCVAISVDYRLGPYAQFPAAIEDAEDIVKAVLEENAPGYHEIRSQINAFLAKRSRPAISLDRERIALSGFSSGGNLALNLVTNVGPPQVPELWPCPFPADHAAEIPTLLYYASVDCRDLSSARVRVPLMDETPQSFWKMLALEEGLMPSYLPKEKGAHPRASPGLATIRNGGLHERAKVFVLLAEKDQLTPQNEAWVRKAKDEGRTDIRVDKFSDVMHGWTQFPDSWLNQHSREMKIEAHDKSVDFVRGWWERS